MLKEEQKSVCKTLHKWEYVFALLQTGFDQSEQCQSWPYLETNYWPAKARRIFITDANVHYQEGLTACETFLTYW